VIRLGNIPAGKFRVPEESAEMAERLGQVLDLVAEIATDAGPVAVTITPVTDENSR
jgi:hypothetical protein